MVDVSVRRGGEESEWIKGGHERGGEIEKKRSRRRAVWRGTNEAPLSEKQTRAGKWKSIFPLASSSYVSLHDATPTHKRSSRRA